MLPGFQRKSGGGRCWFGAMGNFPGQNGRCWFGAVRKNEWIERASAICHRMIASICDLYYNITKQDRLAYVERISCELLLRILRALPMFQRME